MKSKDKILFLLAGIFLAVAFSQIISAVGEVSYCCERTNAGAWCQDVSNPSDCNPSFRSVPTSCESTSYCKVGTCVNTIEGVCMENSPQKVCEEPIGGTASGLWFDSEVDGVPQCQLGCCLIGEQAAFTTQTRCKQLSSLYSLETNYRTDISTEAECIASAFPAVKGACVFEEDFQRTCKFATKRECQQMETQRQNVTFHEGFLCSAEELGTNCGPSTKTTILDGRDEVFFVDTCGNPANIYDSDRQNDRSYWDETIGKAESCGFGNSNAGNPSCGNCDYLSGSTGTLHDRLKDGTAPRFGDYICRDLNCRFEEDLNGDGDFDEDKGELGTFQHGESWCARSSGVSEIISENGNISGIPNSSAENVPGSRYYREVCYNGEVTIEPCADFRQEICIQSSIQTSSGEFRTAACRVNKWQDCIAQTNAKDCINTEKRDCLWTDGDTNSKNGNILPSDGRCVPKYSPGFNFWEENTDADSLCIQASQTCAVKIKKNIKGVIEGKTIEEMCKNADNSGDVEGCECLTDEWIQKANNLCLAMGDCGASVNYINKNGFNSASELVRR